MSEHSRIPLSISDSDRHHPAGFVYAVCTSASKSHAQTIHHGKRLRKYSLHTYISISLLTQLSSTLQSTINPLVASPSSSLTTSCQVRRGTSASSPLVNMALVTRDPRSIVLFPSSCSRVATSPAGTEPAANRSMAKLLTVIALALRSSVRSHMDIR